MTVAIKNTKEKNSDGSFNYTLLLKNEVCTWNLW